MFLFIDKIIKHLLSQELDKYCINSCTYTMHFLAAVSYLLALLEFLHLPTQLLSTLSQIRFLTSKTVPTSQL